MFQDVYGLPTSSIGRTDRSTGTGRGYLQVWNPSMFQVVRHICDQAARPGGRSGSSCSVLPSGAARRGQMGPSVCVTRQIRAGAAVWVSGRDDGEELQLRLSGKKSRAGRWAPRRRPSRDVVRQTFQCVFKNILFFP